MNLFKNIKNALTPAPAKIDKAKLIDKTKQQDEARAFNNRQIYRIDTNIADWRSALAAAESQYTPTRYYLYGIYQDVILDAHVTACINIIKNKILSKSFKVINGDGSKDNEKTEYFKTNKWFSDYLNIEIDTNDYGHSVIQFHDFIDGDFSKIELLKRELINPTKHLYLSNPMSVTGIDYTLPQFSNWILEIGDRENLGTLLKASPYYILKKDNIMNNAIYNEKFGFPVIFGQTEKTDSKTVMQFESALKNFTTNHYLMGGKGDEIKFLSNNDSDGQNYQLFNVWLNTEISKLFLGTTIDTDTSSLASATIHQQITMDALNARLKLIENSINNKLFPFLNKHELGFENKRFVFDYEEYISLKDKFEMVYSVMKCGYEPDLKDFEETFGFKISPQEKTGFDNPLQGSDKVEDKTKDKDIKNLLPDSALNFLPKL